MGQAEGGLHGGRAPVVDAHSVPVDLPHEATLQGSIQQLGCCIEEITWFEVPESFSQLVVAVRHIFDGALATYKADRDTSMICNTAAVQREVESLPCTFNYSM